VVSGSLVSVWVMIPDAKRACLGALDASN